MYLPGTPNELIGDLRRKYGDFSTRIEQEDWDSHLTDQPGLRVVVSKILVVIFLSNWQKNLRFQPIISLDFQRFAIAKITTSANWAYRMAQ